jgi:hypothetical protein
MSMHYFTAIVVDQSTIRLEVLEGHRSHLVWHLPWVELPGDCAPASIPLRVIQIFPTTLFYFAFRRIYFKIFGVFFYSYVVGRMNDRFLCRCKIQCSTFVCFGKITATFGDGLIYWQLSGTYSICRTLICYSSIILWHVESMFGKNREKSNNGRCLVAAFNGEHFPSSKFPN